ncbi:MAG: efflux RND transporter periplasmic adaptor subunit [Chitinivorax sp.]
MMRTHVLLGLSVLSVLSACSNEKPQAKGPNAVDVMVMTVQPTDAPARFQFVGQTESSQQVEIRARVSGFLERRVYQEGSSVKAGQVLFEIDKKPFLAQLQAAKAELAQQQARLLVAKQNLARVKPLAQENALSQKDLDDATGQEQGAAAAVEAAKANVINAELNLGYCTITSPVSGLSSFAKLQDGTYVDPQNSLLTYVAKLDPMRVNFSLSENEALRFKEQIAKKKLTAPKEDKWEVEVLLADGSVYPQRGRLTFSDASFTEDTGTFLVRAEVANPNGALRPGQFVRVNLLGATRPGSFVVP